MAKCKNCVNLVYDWCDMAADSPDPDMERECHWFAHATNYDRVMSKTPEELAEWIVHKTDGNGFEGYNERVEAWLGWLKQEAKA